MIARSLALLAVLVAAAGSAAAASAAATPPASVQLGCLTISGDISGAKIPSVGPGGTVTVVGPPGCLGPGQLLVLRVQSELSTVGEARALEDGTIRLSGTIPPELAPGTHQLELVQGTRTRTVGILVVAPATPAPARASKKLPMKTLALVAMVIAGVVLAVVVLARWVRRKRRSRGAASRRAAAPPYIDTTTFVPSKPTRPGPQDEGRDPPA